MEWYLSDNKRATLFVQSISFRVIKQFKARAIKMLGREERKKPGEKEARQYKIFRVLTHDIVSETVAAK